MGKVTQETVKARLLQLLDTADLATTTERNLKDKLIEELQDPLKEHMRLISDTVKAFVAQQQAGHLPHMHVGHLPRMHAGHLPRMHAG